MLCLDEGNEQKKEQVTELESIQESKETDESEDETGKPSFPDTHIRIQHGDGSK